MDFLAPAIPEGMSVLQPLLLSSCHVGTGHLLLYRRNGMGWDGNLSQEQGAGAVDLKGGPCLRGVRWPGGIWGRTSLAVVTAIGPFLC